MWTARWSAGLRSRPDRSPPSSRPRKPRTLVSMTTFLTILYVIVCIFLILVVLLQAGRGGGMGAAFGGGSSQTVFGGAGAGNFLTRLTVIMAALFMLLSATLAYLSSGSDKALENAAKAIQMREEARKL